MAKGIPDKRVQRIRATAKGALHDSIESWKQTLPVKPEQLCGNEQAKVIGENVYHFRKEAKMSLKVVAEELGISLQALSRIENGDRDKIDIDLFYGLMIVLSCTHDNLLGRAKQRGYVYDDKDEREYQYAIVPCPPTKGTYITLYDHIYHTYPPLIRAFIELAEHGTLNDYKRTVHFLEENIL